MNTQTILRRLEMAGLTKFQVIDQPDAIPTKRHHKVALKAEKKLAKYLDRIPVPINVYLVVGASLSGYLDSPMYSDFGKALSKPKIILNDGVNKEDYIRLPVDKRAMNVILPIGDEDDVRRLHAPTAWIILHRICHYLGSSTRYVVQDWLENLLNDHYRGLLATRLHDEDAVLDIAKALFSFRSAAYRNIDNRDELVVEIIVHIIVSNFKLGIHFPDQIRIRNKEYKRRYPMTQSEIDKLRKDLVSIVKKGLADLKQMRGKYIIV